MKKLFLVFSILTASITVMGQQPIPVKPRILISTDIGGTDPDDNQSMAHFLMYSEMFETEGLVSSPSYGHGSKQNLLDMIDLYEKDLPKLKKYIKGFPSHFRIANVQLILTTHSPAVVVKTPRCGDRSERYFD